MSSLLHTIVSNGHNLASTTRERYRRDLDVWIAYAGVEPAGWTNKRVQTFYSELLKRMKPQSANRMLASLQYASRWMAAQAQNPALDFAASVQKAKPRGSKPQEILDEQEARALLYTTSRHTPMDLRDRALIVVLLETGMRRMSIASMTLQDTVIDPVLAAKRRLPIPPYPTAAVELKGSNGDRVHVPLSDTACAALRPWIEWLHARTKIGPVFQSFKAHSNELGFIPSGARLSDSGIQKLLDTRAELAGFDPPHINPHKFRHTFITWRTIAELTPTEIAAVTHHRVPGLGALGGYINVVEVGARARTATPIWLRELVGG